MNWRKNMVLVVGGAICLVLIIASAYLLFRYRSAYVQVRASEQAAQDRLTQLNQRNPFPSAPNVEVTKVNLEGLDKYYGSILGSLSQGQPQLPTVEPAEFAPMLEKTRQRLLTRALQAGVRLPDRFGFGFARYMLGDLPSTEAIPRLVTQLQAGETVLELLFDARVNEIMDIQRQMFEGAAEAPSSGDRRGGARSEQQSSSWRDIPQAESNELFRAERIYIAFSAKEAALWQLLDSIGSTRPLVVLVDVRFQSPLGFDTRKPAPTAPTRREAAPVRGAPVVGSAAGGGVVTKIPDREERIVAGREAIRVDLVVDVYRFAVPEPAKETKP